MPVGLEKSEVGNGFCPSVAPQLAASTHRAAAQHHAGRWHTDAAYHMERDCSNCPGLAQEAEQSLPAGSQRSRLVGSSHQDKGRARTPAGAAAAKAHRNAHGHGAPWRVDVPETEILKPDTYGAEFARPLADALDFKHCHARNSRAANCSELVLSSRPDHPTRESAFRLSIKRFRHIR